MKQLSLFSQTATLARAGAEGRLYVKGKDLYYGDTGGTEIRITADGSVSGATGTGGGGGVSDHGALTGLSDDDHPQYGLVGSAESVTAVWSFSEGLKVSKEYALASRPAANSTNVDLIIKVYDTDNVRTLQWCAYNGSTYSWVVLGVALP